jgi:[pyruvate, water dikinase]-phosphate phosphotransferase / [pyruvate, water dikinase] kinase
MRSKIVSETFHVHLISDATGETLHAVAKAALAQFPTVPAQEHFHTLVRSRHQLSRTVETIREHPGAVFFTPVDQELRDEVMQTRRLYERQGWPSIDVTRRSVEEIAAAILNLLAERKHD